MQEPSLPGAWQSDHYSLSQARWPVLLQEGDAIPPLLDLDSQLLAAARDWSGVEGWPMQGGWLPESLTNFKKWRDDSRRNRQWELKVTSKARGRLWGFGSLWPDWDQIPAARMGLDVPDFPRLFSPDFDIAAFITRMERNPARDAMTDYHADATRPGPHMLLADITSGSPQDMLAFALRYGLPRVGAIRGPQPYPLLVFAYDALQLRVTAQLAMAVLDVDHAELRRLYIALSKLQGRSREQAERDMEPQPWHSREAVLNEVFATAEAAVMLQVSQRLKSVSLHFGLGWGFGAQEFRRWQGGFTPASLLDACYLMLYWDLTSDRRLCRCANDRCGRLLYGTRPDRAYCSDSCRNAAAVRRHYWKPENVAKREAKKSQRTSETASKKSEVKKKRKPRRTSHPSR